MKGVIQQNLVFQRALRKDHLTDQIHSFEKCDYYEMGKESNIYKYRIHIQESISLQQLIELYSCQLLMIIMEILNHLYQLHQQKLSHGQLQTKNILIRLGNQTGFSITYQIIQIKQILFIRYKYIEDQHYQMNIQDDIKQICQSMIEFIDMMFKKYSTCEKLQSLKAIFSLDNQFQKDAQHLLNLIYEFKKELLNDNEQKLKTNEIDENKGSYLFGIVKPIRDRSEPLVIQYLDELNNQNPTTGISFKAIINDQKKMKGQDCLIEENKQFQIPENFDESSREVLQNLLKMNVLKCFCEDVGKCFQGQKKIEQLLEEFEPKVNNQLQACYELMLPKIINGYQEFDSIYTELQENVDKSFKFKIPKPIEEAKEIYQKEWQLAIQNQEIFNFNFEEYINTVKLNVKSQLQEYYELMVYLENIKLDNDLI